MKLAASLIVALLCVSCSTPNRGTSNSVNDQASNKLMDDKSFVSAGNIEMQLDSGNYAITAASDDRIRVSFGGNSGNATEQIVSTGSQATLTVSDTPQNNFQASIEVPKASNLTIRLKAGNLDLAAISGNKDVESTAGNVTIKVGDPNDYSDVDATVRAGDLNAAPFGKSDSGLGPHLTWTGKGKYTLRANLGPGNLTLN